MKVADIAAKALDKVSAKITDAVHDAVLIQSFQTDYDAATGKYQDTYPRQEGRVVFSGVTPAPDMFPAYTIGPGDELALLEGFTGVGESDLLTVGLDEYTVMAVQDIAGAGTLFNVVLRGRVVLP